MPEEGLRRTIQKKGQLGCLGHRHKDTNTAFCVFQRHTVPKRMSGQQCLALYSFAPESGDCLLGVLVGGVGGRGRRFSIISIIEKSKIGEW